MSGYIGHFVLSSHIKNQPSYHFGTKLADKPNSGQLTPGPAAYFPADKIYRSGKERTPHSVIITRRNEPKSSATATPGPAAYAPVDCGKLSVHYRSPSFTMVTSSNRDVLLIKNATPAPNAYNPDPMLSRSLRSNKRSAPQFSIRSRSQIGGFSEDKSKTPGPGAYMLPTTDRYMRKSCSFSLIGRNNMPGDPTNKPGPAAHSVSSDTMSMLSTKKKGPAYSFGVKHSARVLNLPGSANDYKYGF
ncbi:hypothetical protein HELRODRAFT_181593 [Helobdella robusta]|uniref:Uncharacterized protein n=1 Tax=Helobdella robusta TaxID=6412 RepID=T1FH52_HELRO|nr:hypothetical protein HELRODRAFT_181593 [Helobdella robusta]ESN92254.1 hypothetical protein HELRODRAFT_181593 [Helobdella robusta]